ncbi:MotE family protein [Palleronia abyssalis]|nr:hypothetical protein [Palleronia abyssalis]
MASEIVRVTQAHAATPEQPEDEIATLLAALQAREADLDAREEELQAEADRLEAGREALALQLEEIETAELELRELLQLADRAAEDDLSRLATVYENMKPAEAAPLFEQMPPAFAAGFMGLMSPAASAAILAAMPADVAYAISVMLAGRHADLPEE